MTKVYGIWDEIYDQKCEHCGYDGDGYELIKDSKEVHIDYDEPLSCYAVKVKADYRCPECRSIHTYEKKFVSDDEYDWTLKEAVDHGIDKNMLYDDAWADYELWDRLMDDFHEIKSAHKFVAFCDVARWDGGERHIKVCDGTVKDLIDGLPLYDTVRVRLKDGDLVIESAHHDGTNVYTIRELKDDNDAQMIVDLVSEGKLTDDIIGAYTMTVKPLVARQLGMEE